MLGMTARGTGKPSLREPDAPTPTPVPRIVCPAGSLPAAVGAVGYSSTAIGQLPTAVGWWPSAVDWQPGQRQRIPGAFVAFLQRTGMGTHVMCDEMR